MSKQTLEEQWEKQRNCAHYWIPNSGRGGVPMFRPNRQMSLFPTMHVRCEKCGTRTWFTEKQWMAIPATIEPPASEPPYREVAS